jgi:hypothetical protein
MLFPPALRADLTSRYLQPKLMAEYVWRN